MAVAGQIRRVHQLLRPRVVHELVHDALTLGAGLESDPRDHDRFGSLGLDGLWERSQFARFEVVARTLVDIEGAVLDPDLGKFAGDLAVDIQFLRRDRVAL